MSSPYTPGPWIAHGDNVLDRDGDQVALSYGVSERRYLANARLIAAAPDLLAACEHALALYSMRPSNNCPYMQRDYDMLSAAIAKAKGQP